MLNKFLRFVIASALALACVHAAASGWTSVNPLVTARNGHTATLLPNGKILVAGGATTAVTNAAELFDPSTGTWQATGSMVTARTNHTATLLHNGQVLVVGGTNPTLNINAPQLASVEIYDPASGQWWNETAISGSRENHTATLLANGHVLVVGGYYSTSFQRQTSRSDAQVFDPILHQWSSVTAMPQARDSHTATYMATGQILVAGGYERTSAKITTVTLLNSSAVYNPTSGQWTTMPAMPQGRALHSATLLHDGNVLLAGGDAATTAAAIFAPGANTWTATSGGLTEARRKHSATLLPDGRVLFAGGEDSVGGYRSTAEIFNPDPAPGNWSSAGTIAARSGHTATLLGNGTLVIAGGYSGTSISSVQRYEYAVPVWQTMAQMPLDKRQKSTATLLANGKVMVAGGGFNVGGILQAQSSTLFYNPTDDTWSSGPGMNRARSLHTATLMANGKVLAVGGGFNVPTVSDTAEIFDPSANTWKLAASPAVIRNWHRATLLLDGRVLVTGGDLLNGNQANSATAEIYDLRHDRWTSAGEIGGFRRAHTATLLRNGKVLVAGGGNSTGDGITSSMLYAPGVNSWTATGSMNVARSFHTATLLPSGKVLVTGGLARLADTSGDARAELYDPDTGIWSLAPGTGSPGYDHVATLLPDGKVWLSCGYCSATWLFDPMMPSAPQSSGATNAALYHIDAGIVLPDGRTMVIGGDSKGQLLSLGLNYPPVTRRPVVNSVTNPLYAGISTTLTGYSFTSYSSPSSGNGSDSASSQPLVRLQRLDNGAVYHLTPVSLANSTYTSTVFGGFEMPVGHYSLTMLVNGSPSRSLLFAVIPAGAPDTPVIDRIVAGNGSLTVHFTPGNVDDYFPATYRLTCMAPPSRIPYEASGATSPVQVTGLVNGKSYSCSVVAANSLGSSSQGSSSVSQRPGVSIVPILNLLLLD